MVVPILIRRRNIMKRRRGRGRGGAKGSVDSKGSTKALAEHLYSNLSLQGLQKHLVTREREEEQKRKRREMERKGKKEKKREDKKIEERKNKRGEEGRYH